MRFFGLILSLLLVGQAQTQAALNDPHADDGLAENSLYRAFSAPPRHLDPARSYSSNEVVFTGQIYEPPLQYHYLKRPYALIPLTTTAMPRVQRFNRAGQLLPDTAASDQVAYTEYTISLQNGIRYQPHPAFVRDALGKQSYRPLPPALHGTIQSLDDFPERQSRELIAADYVYQIKRLAHPGLHSPIYGLMTAYIDGLDELHQELKAALTQDSTAVLDLDRYPLRGVQILDRYHYRIRIKGDYPQFVYWLAMPFFAPVPREVDLFYQQPELIQHNLTLDWQPVGTGPYLLAENNPNRRMVLLRNPLFHGERYPTEGTTADRRQGLLHDAGKPLPFVNRVVYTLEKESIPYWNKFLQGYYDTAAVGSDQFDQVIRFSGQELGLSDAFRQQGIHLLSTVAASTYYMGFNMLDPRVGGLGARARKLRQALSIAMNYEEYISIFLNGQGVVAQGPLPPGIFGYRQGKEGIDPVTHRWRHGKAERRSLAVARRLLTEAGYTEGVDPATGKPLRIAYDTVATGPEDKARLQWMRKQMNKLGIQLDVRNTDYNRFQDKMQQGQAQLFSWGWNADYPDPENFLFLLYGPNGKAKYHGENAANYANPEFDRLFERMKSMPNGQERQRILDAMVSLVRQDAPWIWGLHPKSLGLAHGWLYNQNPSAMANNTLKYLRLDGQKRQNQRVTWNQPMQAPLWFLMAALLALLVYAWHYAKKRRSLDAFGRRGGAG